MDNRNKNGNGQEFFRFYRGYAEASREMKPKTRGQFLCAIVDYMLYDEKPDFKPGSTAAAVWGLMKKNLDKSLQYSQNGRGNRNNNNTRNATSDSPPTEDAVSSYLQNKGMGGYATEKAKQFLENYSHRWDEVLSKCEGNWQELCDEWLSGLSGKVNNTETGDVDLPLY